MVSVLREGTLCRTCANSHMVKGFSGKELISCTFGGTLRPVKFEVRECTGFTSRLVTISPVRIEGFVREKMKCTRRYASRNRQLDSRLSAGTWRSKSERRRRLSPWASARSQSLRVKWRRNTPSPAIHQPSVKKGNLFRWSGGNRSYSRVWGCQVQLLVKIRTDWLNARHRTIESRSRSDNLPSLGESLFRQVHMKAGSHSVRGALLDASARDLPIIYQRFIKE